MRELAEHMEISLIIYFYLQEIEFITDNGVLYKIVINYNVLLHVSPTKLSSSGL